MSIYSDVVLADGASAYFRLGEQSGTSAADSIGGVAGVYTGGFTIPTPGLLPSDSNGAVALDGATGRVVVADSSALHLGDAFTLECVVRLSSVAAGSFIDKQPGSYIMRISDTGGSFILRINGVATIVESTIRLIAGVTYHLAATKSGSAVHLYASGADVTGTVANSTMTDNTSALGIGGASGGLAGVIDEVATYKMALTAAQVQQHAILALRARMLASAGAGA